MKNGILEKLGRESILSRMLPLILNNLRGAAVATFIGSVFFCASASAQLYNSVAAIETEDEVAAASDEVETPRVEVQRHHTAARRQSGTFGQWVLGAGPYYDGNPDFNGTYARRTTGIGVGANLGRAGAVGATATAVPDMIGDATFSAARSFSAQAGGLIASNSSSGNPLSSSLTRLNMAENFNVEVQNRVYFDYRHFYDMLSDTNGTGYDIDRYTFGMEKKLGRNTSLEFRLPVLYKMNSTFNDVANYHAELGNVSFAYKQVLYRGRSWTHAVGLGLNLPTAEDWKGYNAGNPVLHIENQICRLNPYYGIQWHPNRYTFGHILAQIDVPLNRDSVTIGDNELSGKISDETTFRLNLSVGRWVYMNERASLVNRIGGLFEVHYSTNLDGMDDQLIGDMGAGPGPGMLYKAPRNAAGNIQHYVHVVNLVGGIPVQLGKTTVITSACVPVTNARYFSTELSVQVSRRF